MLQLPQRAAELFSSSGGATNDALDGDTMLMLFTWNVTSDPRAVLDLHRLGWDAAKIADFVTRSVLATPDGASPRQSP